MSRSRMYQMILALVLLSLGGAVAGQTPKTVRAEKQGMSSERLERITAMSQGYVDREHIPGIMTAVSRGGKLVHLALVGTKGADDPRPLAANDLYRIFSMTKPITAVAAMQLYEEGGFALNDPVSKFIPELAELTLLQDDGTRVPVKNQMTIHQLLTHTAGLSYGFDPRDPVDKLYQEADLWAAADLDEFINKLAQLPLKFEPGEQWHYSVAVDVTGLLVQRISGLPFDEYLRAQIFKPLGMKDTFFAVPEQKQARLLPNHFLDPKTLKAKTLPQNGAAPVPPDTSCYAMCDFTKVTLFSGGGGLVSTMADYLRFTEMLLNDGALDGTRIIGAKTLHYMLQDHLPAIAATTELPGLVGREFRGMGFGLGFAVNNDPVAGGVLGSKGEYTWGGAAGTLFWVDPAEQLIAIAMMQLMVGSPDFRHDLKVAVYQAITESAE